MNSPASFYFVGGTVPNNAPSYVVRQADQDLLDGLHRGQFCYVLTSRQMGKSSLMVRTANRLRQDGVTCAVLDLTSIGQNLSIDRWYDGLLNGMGWQFDLEEELEEFWDAHERLVPLQRFTRALQEVVLKHITGKIVLFVDEVDAVRSLPFSADEFFAGIRECYNRRTENPDFARLTFALFGVAAPGDLIRDTRTTPFNIGHRIELADFRASDAVCLTEGLTYKDAELPGEYKIQLLNRVLYWTGGHPYLTQRLFQAIFEALATNQGEALPPGARGVQNAALSNGETSNPTALVDRLCAELFLSARAIEQDDNLVFVRERLLRSEVDLAGLLSLYGKILAGRRILDDETDRMESVLKLSGVIRAQDGRLYIRNRIYEQVFNAAWVRANMPGAELERQRSAYRRGMIRAAAFFAALLFTVGGLALLALWEAHKARDVSDRLGDAQTKLKITLHDTILAKDRANREAHNAEIAKEHEKALLQQAQNVSAQLKVQKQAAEKEKENALKQSLLAKREGQSATSAQRAALSQLRLSFLRQAQAQQWSGRPGQRFDSMRLLAKAASMHPSPELRLELRNEAIACLALPTDMTLDRRWNRSPHGLSVCGLDIRNSHVFETDEHGEVHVRPLAGGREISVLPGLNEPVLTVWRCSGNGRYATITYGREHVKRLHSVVWDIQEHRRVIEFYDWAKSVDFSKDNRFLAYSNGADTVIIRDLKTGGNRSAIKVGDVVDAVRFDPDGRRLAIACESLHEIKIHDLETAGTVAIRTPVPVNNLDWHPGGKQLAGSCNNGHLYIWDTERRTLKTASEALENNPQAVVFSHRGDLLASIGWDNFVRLWNPATGKQLLASPMLARIVEFSPDDQHLMFASEEVVSLWHTGSSKAYRVLDNGPEYMSGCSFSPDNRLLAVAGTGVKLWDCHSGQRVADLPVGLTDTAAFTPDGAELVTSGTHGLELWPTSRGASKDERRIGPALLFDNGFSGRNRFCLSKDGHTVAAIHQSSHVHVVSLNGDTAPVVLQSQAGMSYIAISPDRRWVTTGAWQGIGVKIWDTSTRKIVKELPIPDQASVTFTPDGQWLVTGSHREYRFWRVGSWTPGKTIARAPGSGWPGYIVFTPDSLIAALTLTDTQIEIQEVNTGRQLATLSSPNPKVITWLSMSPDGSCLAANCAPGEVRFWDLRTLRTELRAIGLDWDAPSYSASHAAPDSPLRVTVLSSDDSIGAGRLVTRLSGMISRSPANIGLRFQRARLYFTLEQPEQAAADLTEAERLAPGSALLSERLAWAYVCRPAKLNAPEKALPFALKATKLQPINADFFFTLGVVYYRLGEFDKALAAWQTDIHLPNSIETASELFFEAMTYQKQGHPEQARAYFEKANQWWKAHPSATPLREADLTAAHDEAEMVLEIKS